MRVENAAAASMVCAFEAIVVGNAYRVVQNVVSVSSVSAVLPGALQARRSHGLRLRHQLGFHSPGLRE